MPSRYIDISLVVSSKDRAGGLLSCLDAIAAAARQTPGASLELVFVDNGSTDATSSVVSSFAASAPLPVLLLNEKRPGLAVARNTGIGKASGRLLAFTDDDCELDPDYFRKVLADFAGDDAPVLRGGRVDLGDERDLPVTIKTDDTPAILDRTLHPGGFVHGCNMVFPRALVDRIGLFDERFGAGAPFRSGEDTDYIHRAFKAGLRVEYSPRFTVRHFHGRRRQADIHKLHSGYAFGNGALYAKYLFDRRSNMRGMLRWDIRQALREALNGPRLSAELGLTYRGTVKDNLAGMVSYWRTRPGRSQA